MTRGRRRDTLHRHDHEQERPMRLAVAHFELESVTFLPDETDIADFEHSARRGAAVLAGLRGTKTVVGGFLAVCEREGVEPVPDRKGTRLNVSHECASRMPSSVCKKKKR